MENQKRQSMDKPIRKLDIYERYINYEKWIATKN
jgi:hypothetical protein